MKKQNKILILMTSILLLPVNVKADMGVPEIQPYKAYIINPNGINVECYEKKYTLELDDVVKVVSEFDETVDIEYNGHYCNTSISVKDIKPILDEYIPTDHIDEVDMLEKSRKIKIKKEGGLGLYSGPSTAFEKILTIPNGYELNYSYSSGDDNGIKPVWLYVEYNGQKGWVKTGQGADGESYLLFHFNNELSIIEDTKLITEEKKEIIVPKNTIINEGFMEHEVFGSTMNLYNSYYVKYNNVYGEINASYVLKYSEEIELLKSHDMYDVKTYDYKDNPDGMPIITLKGEKIGTIPAGTKLSYNIAETDYTFSIAYVEYDGQKGWILIQEDVEYKSNDDENVEDNDDENTITTTTTKPVIKNEKETLSAKELIYLCIGGAAIISLTAVVTLLLINKYKKNKVEKCEEEIIQELNNDEDNSNKE